MNQFSFIIAIVIFSTALIGCEKAANITLKSTENVLVVDASIENNRPPIVVLSKSFNYFSKISADLLNQSFIHHAKINISDGIKTVQLKEYSYPAGSNAVYFYSVDNIDPAQMMLGKLGTAYSMTILTDDGRTYSSKTTIPQLARKMDSLWWKPAPNNSDVNKRVLFAKVTDPPGLGNYVRYFTSVNDSAFLPGLNSVFDDEVVDGTTYDAQIYKGVDKNIEIDRDEFGYFKKGDTVQIKLCNIDKTTFQFWNTLEYSQQAIGNPFSQPGVVLGNISGGALGYFGGYAAQYKKTIIKD